MKLVLVNGIMKRFLLLIFLFNYCHSEEILKCQTFSQNGFEFIGKDYEQIISHLGFSIFDIKLSRTREDIFLQEKKNTAINKNLSKSSHFLELVVIKSNGYPIPFHCSWMFNIQKDKIENGQFNCNGHPENRSVFSLDYDGNFIFSSNFEYFLNNNNLPPNLNATLHSLMGKCFKKKK